MMAQKSTENWRELEVWKVVVFDAVYGINITYELLTTSAENACALAKERRRDELDDYAVVLKPSVDPEAHARAVDAKERLSIRSVSVTSTPLQRR